jgi:hypothetical protein
MTIRYMGRFYVVDRMAYSLTVDTHPNAISRGNAALVQLIPPYRPQKIRARLLLLLVHHNIVLRLTLCGRIHRGDAHEIVLFGVEFDRRPFYLGWDSGKFGFALGVGVNTHIELVRAKRPVCQMDINASGIDRLAVRVCYREFDGAGPGSSIRDGNVVRLLRLSGLLGLRGNGESHTWNQECTGKYGVNNSSHKLALIIAVHAVGRT